MCGMVTLQSVFILLMVTVPQLVESALKGRDTVSLSELGDNIFGSSTRDVAESLRQAFGLAMESCIPWAAVLGNHDHESSMNREELMSFMSLMDYSVSQINPSFDGLTRTTKGGVTTKIDGFGNYNIKVYGAPDSTMANNSILNLFFLDSGGRAFYQGFRTYKGIGEYQLNWLQIANHLWKHSKVQLATLYNFLLSNCGDGMPLISSDMPHT